VKNIRVTNAKLSATHLYFIAYSFFSSESGANLRKRLVCVKTDVRLVGIKLGKRAAGG